MHFQKKSPIKRFSEDSSSSSRPLKRNSSFREDTSTTSLFTPPSTPRKPSLRSNLSPRSKLVTSFKNVFGNSNTKDVFNSPVSDSDSQTSSPTSSVLSTPILQSSPFTVVSESDSPLAYSPELSPKTLNFEEEFNHQLSSLTIQNFKKPTDNSHIIFHIPEILTKILSYVDEFTNLPCEESPIRRRPLSYQHALLIYKDEKRASQVWSESVNSSIESEGNPPTTLIHNTNSLYNCMLVNKLWYQVTMELASTKLFFTNDLKWNKFVEKSSNVKTLRRSSSNTKLFIMHKLSKAKQEDIEMVSPLISGNLEWIEMYICPKILPTPLMLTGSRLQKLVLPGSKMVNDSFLRLVGNYCPNIIHLDLRACELVSDEGITYLASRCPKLNSLNLGRHSHGERITDVTLNALSKFNKIETLGVAGCIITDSGLWDLVTACSDSITRLSLNNCIQLTNNSIPRMIAHGYLPKLSVLELRHNLMITNFKPLVQFKRYKEFHGESVLIEGCEVLEYRMRSEEWKQDMKNSAKILNDVQNWCNDDQDDDVPYTQIMKRLYSS